MTQHSLVPVFLSLSPSIKCDSACKKLRPVYEQVAAVLHEIGAMETTTRVAVCDVGENFHPSLFATADEARGTPLLKLFAADGTTHVLETPPITPRTILSFIHQHATHKFDLQAAHAACDDKDAATDAAVHDEVVKQLEAHLAGDRKFAFYDQGPCSKEWREWIVFFSQLNFVGGSDDERTTAFHGLREQYQQCARGEEYIAYWKDMREHAKTEVTLGESAAKKMSEEEVVATSEDDAAGADVEATPETAVVDVAVAEVEAVDDDVAVTKP
jgi:hypothetical protein